MAEIIICESITDDTDMLTYEADLKTSEELKFPLLDGIVFPLVVENADVVGLCKWMDGAEVTLTVALNNYYQMMTEECAYQVLDDIRDFLASSNVSNLEVEQQIEVTEEAFEWPEEKCVFEENRVDKKEVTTQLPEKIFDIKIDVCSEVIQMPLLESEIKPQKSTMFDDEKAARSDKYIAKNESPIITIESNEKLDSGKTECEPQFPSIKDESDGGSEGGLIDEIFKTTKQISPVDEVSEAIREQVPPHYENLSMPIISTNGDVQTYESDSSAFKDQVDRYDLDDGLNKNVNVSVEQDSDYDAAVYEFVGEDETVVCVEQDEEPHNQGEIDEIGKMSIGIAEWELQDCNTDYDVESEERAEIYFESSVDYLLQTEESSEPCALEDIVDLSIEQELDDDIIEYEIEDNESPSIDIGDPSHVNAKEYLFTSDSVNEIDEEDDVLLQAVVGGHKKMTRTGSAKPVLPLVAVLSIGKYVMKLFVGEYPAAHANYSTAIN